MSPKVCALIVTYFPDTGFLKTLEAAVARCEHVVIVDNTDGDQLLPIFSGTQNDPQITLIQNKMNLGIASALNTGVKWAIENNFEWILTLDQDTIIEKDMVDIMLDAYEKAPEKEKIGILAPIHYDKKSGYQSKYLQKIQGPYLHTNIVMTSGNLIPVSTFERVGFFDDDLFIEYVDHDYCLKLTKAGLRVVLVVKARMAHELGSIKLHKLGPLFFFSHNYKPVRRYYRARNRLILYRRHFQFPWILKDQEFAIKDMIKIFLVENQKWAKVKATIYGTIDGLLGRMGGFDGANYLTPKASKYFIEFREEIVPLLPEFSEKVLDLGCGSGETSAHLKKTKRFGWVCGVEGSPDAAAVARKVLDDVLEGDIEKMNYPFAEGTFDTILALDILEHLVDPWTVLKQLTKLLKPGGVIVTSIPNVRHYSVVIPLVILGDWRYQQEGLLDSTHIRFFTSRTAVKLMTSTGLKVEELDHTGAKRGLGHLVNNLTFGLFKQFFIFQNLIRVRKPK